MSQLNLIKHSNIANLKNTLGLEKKMLKKNCQQFTRKKM